MTARHEIVATASADAPWLVMVHGMSQDRRVFDVQVAAFRERYRILLVDLPGHGLSSDLPGPYGHDEFARSVAGALEAAKVTPCHYWGTHTGATVGLLLAARSPGLFRSLILEGPVMPGEAPPSVAGAISGARRVAAEQGVVAARAWWFEESPWFEVMHDDPDGCRTAIHRAIVEEFGGAPWLSADTPAAVEPIETALSALSLPVLIYNGERDLPDFLETAGRLEKLIPGCRRASVPRGGAFPAWEYPEPVNELVRGFLDGVSI